MSGGFNEFMMGGVVVAALLIYRIVDHMLNKYSNNNNNNQNGGHRRCPCVKDVDKMAELVDHLSAINWKEFERKQDIMFALHDVKDSDGVPIWYVRSTLEDAINKLIKAIENQTQLVSALVCEVREHLKKDK